MKWLLLAAVCGCGRIGFEGVTDSQPTVVDADTSCWPLWHAGTIEVVTQPITELNTPQNETNAFLMADGRRIYYNANGAGRDIVTASRADATSAWGNVTSLTVLNSTADDARLAVTADGSVGMFASTRTGGSGNFDLYYTTSPDGGATFTAPTRAEVAQLNTVNFEGSPELSGDGLRVYYTLADGNPQRLVVAERTSLVVPFGAPVNVPGLDALFGFGDASLSPDESVIIMTATVGDSDIYYATRPTRFDPFGAVSMIPSITTATFEDDPAFSTDGCAFIYMTSAPSQDLFLATVLR